MPTVSDIMTKDVLTLDPDMSLRDAVEILGDGRVTGAPVLQGSKLVGVVSATDLLLFQEDNPALEAPDEDHRPTLREELESEEFDTDAGPVDNPEFYFGEAWGAEGADAYQRMASSDSERWDLLARHTVGEVMTRKTITLAPDTELREAARTMTEQKIHRVLVTDGDSLTGIITSMDMVRAISEGMLD